MAFRRRCSSPGRSRCDVLTVLEPSTPARPPPLQMPFAFEVFTWTLPRSSTVLITWPGPVTGKRPSVVPPARRSDHCRSTSGGNRTVSCVAVFGTWWSSSLTSVWWRCGDVTTTVGSEWPSESDTGCDESDNETALTATWQARKYTSRLTQLLSIKRCSTQR